MSNINKTTDVSKLAHQANFLIQQNKILTSVIEEYKNQISLNNSYLQQYLHSTQPDCASILSNLNSHINELKQKHSYYLKKCKELEEKYETNISVINNIIQPLKTLLNKTKEDNFELLNRIEEFYSLNLPLMLGISRKSFLGIENNDNDLKDSLTLALSYPLINKVDYLRVHNVKLHRQLLSLAI